MILQQDSNKAVLLLESGSNLRQENETPIVLAIHGGAGGTIPPNMPPEMEARYRTKLRDSLTRGYEILNAGGTALDAVCAAVVEMEDCELFNAGKGAVFNASGENECEASVMIAGPPFKLQRGTSTGEDEKSGKETETQESFSSSTSISQSRRGAAVTLVRQTKNPILLAKALYENPSDNPHVFMSGEAAEEIGWKLGCEKVGKDYYWTKRRWLEHRRGLGLPDDDSELLQQEGEEVNCSLETESAASMPSTTSSPPSYTSLQKSTASSSSTSRVPQRVNLGETDSSRATASRSEIDVNLECLPKGTVGAVALDRSGRLACATSTGGKTNKLKGRIGDTPSIGSGFWAEVWKSDQMNISSSPSLTKDPDHQDSDQDRDSNFCSRLLSCFSSDPRDTQIEDEELGNVNKPVTRPPTFIGLEGVAISGTGDGDYFLRISFASLVAHRMRLRGETSEDAGRKAIDELTQVGGKGTGGSIILDLKGKVSFPMNSATMNRGFISSESGAVPRVAIFDYETCK